MKVWLVRHGQTDLNKKKLLQGRSDSPLNDYGIQQAESVREQVKDIHFDAVFASTLQRAIKTASIISGEAEENIIKDERLLEVSFGSLEYLKYSKLGVKMTLHWLYPEIFPEPEGVEPTKAVIARAKSFLADLKTKDYENVLICCHGDFIRFFARELSGNKHMITWRDFGDNCEVRKFNI